MSEHECAGRVYSLFHSYPCGKPGKHEEDGKWWCGIHAPSKIAARKAKTFARWEAKRAVHNKQYAKERAAREIVEAALKDDATALKVAVAAYRAIENARDA